MKKQILFIFFICLLLSNNICAQAKTIVAETLCDFDSMNPPKEFSVKIIEDTFLNDEFKFEKDAVINGKITKVIPPKRLKQDACFVFKAKNYTIPSQDNKIIKIKNTSKTRTKVKPYIPVDKTEMAEKAALAVAGTMVKGISVGINFAKGVIKPSEGENRLHSGVKNAYENSPLSYYEKGDDLVLKAGSLVKFSLDEDLFEN